MRIVTIPGYADTVDYWAHLVEERFDQPAERLRWPGLWGAAPSVGNPIDAMVTAASLACSRTGDDSSTLLVAHSLGARIACEAAVRTPATHLVLIAPAFEAMSFTDPTSLYVWRANGTRVHRRPSPNIAETCGDVDVEVPWSYGAALSIRPPAPIPERPTLIITMSADTDRNVLLRNRAGRPDTTLVDVDGPHRWWEDPDSASQVIRTMFAWSAQEAAS